MGISQGTLIKRGQFWHWKFRCDGEVRWESLKVTSKREAERLRQQRIAEYLSDSSAFERNKRNATIDYFEQVYWPWAEAHKSPRTIEVERMFWRELKACTNPKRLGDVKKRDIERFKVFLKDGGTTGHPKSNVSVNNALRHVQAMFNHAGKLELFGGVNPVVGVERYRVHETKPDFLTEAEIERLLETAEQTGRDIHWVFLLGIYAGLRKNEIVNTRWEWFDFDERTITVKRHEGFDIKDRAERVISMSGKIHAALSPHQQESGFLLDSGRKKEGKHRYRYEPNRAFKAVREKANVPKATYQLLRHTFGSQHAIAGTSIYKISRWMGHSSVDVTTKHYAGLQEYDEDIDRF